MKIYIDGSSTPNNSKVVNKAKYAVVIHSDYGNHQWVQDVGNKTNNEAEYEALQAALEFSVGYGHTSEDITIYTDSKLVYGQVMKGWKCQEKFRGYLDVIRVLLPIARLEWIPREQNLAGKLLE